VIALEEVTGHSHRFESEAVKVEDHTMHKIVTLGVPRLKIFFSIFRNESVSLIRNLFNSYMRMQKKKKKKDM